MYKFDCIEYSENINHIQYKIKENILIHLIVYF